METGNNSEFIIPFQATITQHSLMTLHRYRISDSHARDVIQNSSVLTFVYNVFAIMQDINEYSCHPVDREQKAWIRGKFNRIERVRSLKNFSHY